MLIERSSLSQSTKSCCAATEIAFNSGRVRSEGRTSRSPVLQEIICFSYEHSKPGNLLVSGFFRLFPPLGSVAEALCIGGHRPFPAECDLAADTTLPFPLWENIPEKFLKPFVKRLHFGIFFQTGKPDTVFAVNQCCLFPVFHNPTLPDTHALEYPSLCCFRWEYNKMPLMHRCTRGIFC